MKSLKVLVFFAALAWGASAAWAQLGLYGSPGLVALPPAQPGVPPPYEQPAMMPVFYDAAPAQPLAGPWDAQPVPPAYSLPAEQDPGYAPQSLPVDAAPLTQSAAWKRPRSKEPPKAEPPQPEPPKPESTVGPAPSVVNEMLGEAGGCLPPPWGPEPGCTPDACGGAFDACDPCLACFQPKWYVSVTGLVMARGDRPNKVWTSYEFSTPSEQVLNTWDDLEWRGGGEVRFGRSFCCGSWSIEAAYWTLDPFTSLDRVTSGQVGDLLATPLDFQDVDYANPAILDAPGDLFNQAREHRVWRRDEVHSVEINVIRNRVDSLCYGPFDCAWSVGARYFRFEEDLRFGSLDEGGIAFGIDPTLEGYLDEKIINHLVGAQLACDLNYRRGAWALFATPRVGIYNNHIKNRFSAYRGDGELFDTIPADYPGYPVESTRDVFALLTEVDVGLQWQFAAQWSAAVGYRLTVATGVGLADHQIPFYVVDTPEIADIDYNGYLLLHGGFAGVTYRF